MGKRPFYVIDRYTEYNDGGERNSDTVCILHKKEEAIARFKYLYNISYEDFVNTNDIEHIEHSFNITNEVGNPLRGGFHFFDENNNDYISYRLSEMFTDTFKGGSENAYKERVLATPEISREIRQ